MFRDIVEYEVDESFTIVRVSSRSLLDSRGKPTVEVEVITEGGGVGASIVPSGASKGKYEAVELRDESREYRGLGVEKAVKNVNEIIAPQIEGLDSRRQWEIDSTLIRLDGTPNKSRLGANATLAVSIACAKAAADTLGLPLYMYIGGLKAKKLPTPMLNVINGGLHAGNELSIQEFMIVPGGFEKYSDAIRASVEVYYTLKDVLKDKYGASAVNVGDEGGYAPPLRNTEDALRIIREAIEKSGYNLGVEISLAIDAAASNFYRDGKYYIDGVLLETEELSEYYEKLVEEYKLVSIEDPFFEEDFKAHSMLTSKLKGKTVVVGDDLLVTSVDRLGEAVLKNAVSGVIVKPNQAGTLSETLDFTLKAESKGLLVIVSHRSGETEDSAISDLAVGLEADCIKAGAPARGERTAKYNRLKRIEEILGEAGEYAGFKPFKKIA